MRFIASILCILMLASCGKKPVNEYKRSELAPVQLAYVDFKIRRGRVANYWGTNIGQYKFSLSCTRWERGKDITLNTSNVMKTDMRFFENAFEVLNDDYPIVIPQTNRYYYYSDKIDTPEYLLTGEIKGLYLNVCDDYHWRRRDYKNTRSGSAEITVEWRLMDIAKRHLFWKEETNGYGEIMDGVANGETELVEKAFSDALRRATFLPGFRETLTKRIPYADLKRMQKELDDINKAHLAVRNDAYDKYYKEKQKEEAARKAIEDKKRAEEEAKAKAIADAEAAKKATTAGDGDNSGKNIASGGDASGKATSGDGDNNGNKNTALVDKDGMPYGGWEGISSDKNPPFLDDIVIDNVLPYDKLTAANLYKVRASVVGVANIEQTIGSGLIISPDYVLTANGLVANNDNKNVVMNTINNRELYGAPIRRHVKRDSAIVKLDYKTEFSPLPLRLDLPEVGEEVFIALGAPTKKTGEGYLDDYGRVKGYRYTEGGAEIVIDTDVQRNTLGGALIDKKGNILGMAHAGEKLLPQNEDYFIPIAEAFKSLNVRIRGREFPPVKKNIKYIEDATKTHERFEPISGDKAAEKPAMPAKEEYPPLPEANISKDDLAK